MKKIIISFLFIFTTGICFSQTFAHLTDSIYSSVNGKYIRLYISNGGKLQKDLGPELKQNKQILSINYGDTLFKQPEILQPDISHLIKMNLEEIKKVRDLLNDDKKRVVAFRKAYLNKEITVSQLGIKFNELNYNHYPQFTAKEIENKKTGDM